MDENVAVWSGDRMEFPTIDVLRGFAAVSVVVYHVIEHFGWAGFPVQGPLVWFRIGWMGVDLFLAISGFVISLSIASLLQKHPYRAFIAEFARRRLARIGPLYYTTCVLYVVLVVPQLLPQPDLYKHVLAHIFFLHNLVPEYSGSINGPNWSVGLEVQFYLLCCVVAPVLWRCPWWQIAIGAVAISWAWRLTVVWLVPFDQPGATFLRFVGTTQLPGTLDEFAAGILLARFISSHHGARVLRWGNRRPLAPVAVAVAGVWLTLHVFWLHAAFWDAALMVVFWRTGCATTFALVLFAACCLNAHWFRVASAPLRYLGTISFGIYLWHLPVLLSVKRVEWIPAGQALWIVLAATLVLAAGSWHFLEQPMLRKGRGNEKRGAIVGVPAGVAHTPS